MSRPVLELVEITKCFRQSWTLRAVRAVDGLSIAVHDGEVLGLIGHNGAGKTTTLKLVVGLLRPTQGTVLWDGAALEWQRPRAGIGFSPEQPYFHEYLTARETLHFYGQLYGLGASERRQRVERVATELRITHKMDAPMRTLSKGTLQRVAVAQAIMHDPRLAILDEPMSGLDPAGRKDMRDLILSRKRNGTTVLFSSHILSDAEALCDRVAILAGGQLREVVTLHTDGVEPTSYRLTLSAVPDHTLEVLARMAIEPPAGGPHRWTMRVKDRSSVRAALAALQAGPAQIEALEPERPSLEQRFLQYAGNGSHGD